MSFTKYGRKLLFLLCSTLQLSSVAKAEGPPEPSSTNNPFVSIMIIIIIILGLAIALLANVLLGAAQISRSGVTEDLDGNERPEATVPPRQAGLAGPLGIVMLASMVKGLTNTAFYMIIGVITLEVVILLALLYNVRLILSIHKIHSAAVPESIQRAAPRPTWWDKINRFRPVDQEKDIDMGHEYDGIRELDNRLPPWWLYGFYCTIFFACVYLWRYHVSHSAPLSGEEYQIALKEADIQKAEYLKNAADNVDENTVKVLTDPDALAAGKTVFQSTCFACHGKSGEGGVGPNLTDEYWLHGGSIQEVFRTIKYGWPEKGMKSWKDDYSPSQIAQIASYVKSLGGTHPANPKPPQGILAK